MPNVEQAKKAATRGNGLALNLPQSPAFTNDVMNYISGTPSATYSSASLTT